MGDRKLTDAELVAAKHNRAQGEASLACEGMYLTAEENALFDRFEEERLPHDESRRQILEFLKARQRIKAPAAE